MLYITDAIKIKRGYMYNKLLTLLFFLITSCNGVETTTTCGAKSDQPYLSEECNGYLFSGNSDAGLESNALHLQINNANIVIMSSIKDAVGLNLIKQGCHQLTDQSWNCGTSPACMK